MHAMHAGRVALLLLTASVAACFDFGGYTRKASTNPTAACEPWYGPCDTFPQCECPEGEACDVVDVLTGETGCIAPTGLQRGEVCTDYCDAWLTCVQGTCKQYCEIDTDCPIEGAVCAQVLRMDYESGARVAVPGMRACTDQCDPREPQGMCGQGAGCYPYDELWRTPGHTICGEAGAFGPDAEFPCSSDSDCVPAYACTAEEKCRPWCRVGDSSDCPEPLSCHELKNKNGVVGYYFFENQAYGACY